MVVGGNYFLCRGLEIFITSFDPLKGKGHKNPLPERLHGAYAIANMQNDDDECFKWAVTRTLNPAKRNPARVTKLLREQARTLDWSETEFPTKVEDIHKWEKVNGVNVNVFGYDEDTMKMHTMKLGSLSDTTTTISLFLHNDNHYCAITDLSRLIGEQLSKSGHRKHVCLRCIKAFGLEKPLEEHKELCDNHELQRSVYPSWDRSFVMFENYERTHYVYFYVNADFECFIEPIDHANPDPRKSSTTQYQKHRPSGFCYTIKCTDESVYKTKTVQYTMRHPDEDIGKKFNESLESELGVIH